MAKKTYNQKLSDSKNYPLVEDMSDNPEYAARYGGNSMLIAAPLQYNEIMSRVPAGYVITSDRIRAYLARKHGADVTCPLTAGIFMNICAHAAIERTDDGFPWWRTLKANGELNEKFPDGLDGQKLRLEMEGHEIVKKGKRMFVLDYDKKLWDIED